MPGMLDDTGRSDGTTITVRDLFYNTPARMKFLKKDVAEANACAGVIDKLALSHPEISFKFIREGKEALFTPGDGEISSAVYSVYGKDFFAGMIPVNYELGGIKISGFISKPSASKASRSMQNFFINGRYVKSKVGSTALEEAFKNSIMVGKFPYCVVYINILPTLVDVNVHPSKTEVKFVDEKNIFEAVYYGVKNALMNSNGSTMILNNESPEPLSNARLMDSVDLSQNFQKSARIIPEFFKIPVVKNEEPAKSNPLSSLFDKIQSESQSSQIVAESPCTHDLPDKSTQAMFHESFEKKSAAQTGQVLKMPEEKSIRIIGEVFDCYIVMESENELILVDKHAAHERIIFEKLKKDCGENESQGLLEPIIVTLEKEEYGAILENPKLLSKAGYVVEDFGSGTVIVRSVPMYINFDEVPDSIVEIANYIIDNKKSIDTKKLDWLYHNIACRSAIKGGKGSSANEIGALVKKLLENPDIQHCPHGRPIYVSITRKFIEKQFGRA
jgi:DNA mismatch repair protein MutL